MRNHTKNLAVINRHNFKNTVAKLMPAVAVFNKPFFTVNYIAVNQNQICIHALPPYFQIFCKQYALLKSTVSLYNNIAAFFAAAYKH